MTDRLLPEAFARTLLMVAVAEGRAAELLDCLHGGGSATVDQHGLLALVTGEQLADMMTPWDDEPGPAPVVLVTLDDDAGPDFADVDPAARVVVFRDDVSSWRDERTWTDLARLTGDTTWDGAAAEPDTPTEPPTDRPPDVP